MKGRRWRSAILENESNLCDELGKDWQMIKGEDAEKANKVNEATK
jgi:hypothetical protein